MRMNNAETINYSLESLPVAEKVQIQAKVGDAFEDIERFRAIRVTNSQGKVQYVSCPTKSYALVQHKDAFKPIVEGLKAGGIDNFQYIFLGDHKKVQMQIYATPEGADTVKLGFYVVNSFDGSVTLNYGFKMDRSQKYVEIVGYRQVCGNGMKIRVPLEEAEFVRPELREKITSLFNESTSLKHTESVYAKIDGMRYIVEAMSLLQEPVNKLIEKAQKFDIDDKEELKRIIVQYVGKRYARKIEDEYNLDRSKAGYGLWGLYNAITHIATHDTKMRYVVRESLKEKASEMLTSVITAEV